MHYTMVLKDCWSVSRRVSNTLTYLEIFEDEHFETEKSQVSLDYTSLFMV